LLRKRMTERCSSLVHVASGAAILNWYCGSVSLVCSMLPLVGHSLEHW
jgi:hypothetical protein